MPIELWNMTLKMFFLLAVMAALFLMAHFGLQRLSRKQGVRTGRMPIEIIFSRYLGSKKSISMVKVPGAILVLGITPDRINLLSRIEEAELIESICQDEPGKALPLTNPSFLKKFYFRFLLRNWEKPFAKKKSKTHVRS
jgi:flagellar biogenesis protein FliO